ncbi:MAG: acetylxylan esterase [Phycisphaerales bacterium]|nr:acetylxylan esterase [Phycisphaerales bacterium]
MPEPDDFGLSPVATLAHVSELTPAPMHQPVWNRWREALASHHPQLVPAETADPADPTATHRFESVGSVRIGCVLELPPKGTLVRAALVTTHGYGVTRPLAEEARRWRALAARGVAVLLVRVRGYPGSTLDTGNWAASKQGTDAGWIAHGFRAQIQKPEDALQWSLPLAAADVALAARALRDWLGSRARQPSGPIPVSLHGESFGAGLAVICAAQTPPEGAAYARLALAVPTFGDWSWRLADPRRMAFGAGAHLHALLRSIANTEPGGEAAQVLRLCDTAVHATRIRCPVLCRLAERDEVVPAPSAAAVFNALGSDPGMKWRFVVPEGHAEPSIRGARRLALFERCLVDFLDPSRPPAEAMEPWEGLMSGGERPPRELEAPITGEQGALFATSPPPTRDGTDALLVAAYARAGRTLDDLPYTSEWAAFYAEIGGASGLREREAFHRLHNLRKAGKLPRMGRATSSPPQIEGAEEQQLASMVTAAVGTLGQRDQLPFTPEFDRLALEFNRSTGRDLPPHDVWRLIAKLAK